MSIVLSDSISSLKRSLDNEDHTEIISSLFTCLNALTFELSSRIHGNQKSEDSLETAIIKCFDSINNAFNYNMKNNIIPKAQMNQIEAKTRESFSLSIQFPSGSSNFQQKIWKMLIDIASKFLIIRDTSEWNYTVYLAFNFKNASDRKTYEQTIIKKMEYLFQQIQQNYPTTTTKWISILCDSLFGVFIEFYNFEPASFFTVQHANEKTKQLPPKFVDLMLDFIQNSSFSENFEIDETNPTSFVFLCRFLNTVSNICFLNESSTAQKIENCFDNLIKYWSSLKETKKYQVLRRIRAKTPETQTDLLMIIIKRLILKCNKIEEKGQNIEKIESGFLPPIIKEENYGIFKEAQREWRSIFEGPIPTDTLKIVFLEFQVQKQRSLGFPILFGLINDFKVNDPKIHEFIKGISLDNSWNKDIPAVTGIMNIACLGIQFSPLFLGFDEGETMKYVQKVKEREQRGTQAPASFNINIINIFSDPVKYFLNSKQRTKFIKRYISQYKWYLYPIDLKKWTYDEALEHINFFLAQEPSLLSPLIIILEDIQQHIPISMQKNPSFICSNYFDQAVELLDADKPNIKLFMALAASANLKGTKTASIIDPQTQKKWIGTICHFLCSTNEKYMKTSFLPAIQSIIQFAPHSMIIIVIIWHLLTANKDLVQYNEIESFIINSFILASNESMYPLSFDMETVISGWKEDSFNQTIINCITPISKYDSPIVLKNLIIPNLNMLYHDKSFNALLCIYMNEAKNKRTPALNNIEQIFSTFMSDPELINARLFCSIAYTPLNLKPTNKAFCSEYSQSLLSLLSKERNNEENVWAIFTTLLFLLSKGTLPFDKFAKKLNKLTDKNKNYSEFICSLIPAIPFSMLRKPINIQQFESGDAIINVENSNLIEVKQNDENREEDELTICMHSATYSAKFSTKAIKQKEPMSSLVLPETENELENEENEEENNNAIRIQDFLTNIMKSQCIYPQNFEMTSAAEEITINPIQIDDERKEPSHYPKAEESDFSTIIHSCPSALPLYTYALSNSKHHVNQSTQTLERSSRALMQLGVSEEAKIGVLYVGPTQFTQKEILGNRHCNTSQAYDRFIRSLGEVVDIKKHKYYTGKLDATSSPLSIFYSDAEYDVMFHVATLMKTSDDDEQQIAKKRHIGNDNVHIIWCDNKAGYDPDTIPSQFNDAHIVIIPYDTNEGIYRVVVYKKRKELDFGPLPPDSLVSADALVPLVRMTAINADRMTREGQDTIPPKRFSSLMQQFEIEI